jgi:hypothetical protein
MPYRGPYIGSGENDSIADHVNGDLLFYIIVPFIIFLLYIGWRVRKSLKDEERRAKLLKLKRKILRRKEE